MYFLQLYSRRDGKMLKGHNERLQSIRGLAALTVAFGHSSLVIDSYFGTGVGLLFQQGSAVLLFYVLSGLVLGESLRRQPHSFRHFLVRRAARLLPVFWITMAIGVLVGNAMHHAPIVAANNDWFNAHFLSIDTSWRAIILSFFGMATPINGVLWSVQVEICVAPFLPLMVALADRSSTLMNVVIFTALFEMGLIIRPIGVPLAYHWCFYLGIILPQLLSAPSLMGYFRSGRLVAVEFAGILLLALWHNPVAQYILKPLVDVLFSAHLLGWVITSDPRQTRLFSNRILVWLGDISFSFYAFSQMTLVLIAFEIFLNPGGAWLVQHKPLFTLVVGMGATVISAILGYFSYRFIELPGMRLGKEIAAILPSAV